jgi:cyclic pyranopterin phosphate synthase
MPEEGIQLLSHKDILTFDEITDFTKVAVKSGITKVRITGGEPLVRRGITTLVEMIAAVKGISDLSMTTNGVLLGKFAQSLKNAGLHRVNISLDTVDPERFEFLTRGGKLPDVLEGIEAARKAALTPVKINCVIKNSKDEPDAQGVTDYCERNGLTIRYIRQMDLVTGHFSTVEGGTGGECFLCNRLRLTSNGKLKPCLFDDTGIDIRETGYEEAIRKAIDLKPECGTSNISDKFYNIGG